MKKKVIKKSKIKRKIHLHKWTDKEIICHFCGHYEAYCKGCKTVGLFSGQGTLIDTAN